MLDHDTVLDTVNKAYAARRLGDKEALRTYFAPDAVFRMVGRSKLLGGLPVGPADAATAVDHLIDLFRFHEMTQERVIVDGQTVMSTGRSGHRRAAAIASTPSFAIF